MQIRDVMTTAIFTVPIDLRVSEALLLAQAADLHHLLLTDCRCLVGVTCVCELSLRDPMLPLRHFVPRSQLRTVEAESPLESAAKRFVEARVGCFPVLDGNQLVGVVTRGDLRRAQLDDAQLPPGLRCSRCGETRHVQPRHGGGGLATCGPCAQASHASG